MGTQEKTLMEASRVGEGALKKVAKVSEVVAERVERP